jgi:hypothetical protein
METLIGQTNLFVLLILSSDGVLGPNIPADNIWMVISLTRIEI